MPNATHSQFPGPRNREHHDALDRPRRSRPSDSCSAWPPPRRPSRARRRSSRGRTPAPSCTRSARWTGARPTWSTSRSSRAGRRAASTASARTATALIHFAGTHQSVDTYSANGIDVVVASTGRSRDHGIAYNGDGTLTIRFTDSSTTNASIDGVPLFREAGLVDGAVLIDHGDTPTDPGDDIFLGATGGVSHGHSRRERSRLLRGPRDLPRFLTRHDAGPMPA